MIISNKWTFKYIFPLLSLWSPAIADAEDGAIYQKTRTNKKKQGLVNFHHELHSLHQHHLPLLLLLPLLITNEWSLEGIGNVLQIAKGYARWTVKLINHFKSKEQKTN